MTKKKPVPPEFAAGHIGFDLDGTPLPMSSSDVKRRTLSALYDPTTEIVLAVVRHRGDLVIQVMGEPNAETRDELLLILQRTADAYARILKGQ